MDLQPGLADFRLLDRQALKELLRFSEEGLFLRGLTEWIGFPACAIPYQPGKRVHGKSQYSLKKMIKLGWRRGELLFDHAACASACSSA